MANFELPGDIDLQQDDTLSIVDGVRRGDLVYFERVDNHTVHLRTLTTVGPHPSGRRIYQVDRGDDPETLTFTPVSEPSGDVML